MRVREQEDGTQPTKSSGTFYPMLILGTGAISDSVRGTAAPTWQTFTGSLIIQFDQASCRGIISAKCEFGHMLTAMARFVRQRRPHGRRVVCCLYGLDSIDQMFRPQREERLPSSPSGETSGSTPAHPSFWRVIKVSGRGFCDTWVNSTKP